MTTVAVVGATGYTGTLVVAELVRRRIPVVAVGRSREKLDAIPGVVDRRVADALDVRQVRKAVDGCGAIVSCVGPFVDLGRPTLEAAIGCRAHYLDTTGEQEFIRRVTQDYDVAARNAGVVLLSGIGFDYVPGDMAASLAAQALSTAPETIKISYLLTGVKSSDGTKRTGLRVAELPCYVLRDGVLTAERTGSHEHLFDFGPPHGRENVALWPGGEVVTVPRHTAVKNLSVYMRIPKVAAAAARIAVRATPVLRAGRALAGSATSGPSGSERQQGRYVIIAEALADGRMARCVIEGKDMYGLTAGACAEAVEHLAAPGFSRSGALAPSEAFEPRSFLSRLDAFLSWRIE